MSYYSYSTADKTAVSFKLAPLWLESWAENMDRRYWTFDKGKQGIVSYDNALKELVLFFRRIKLGEIRPNSRSVSAWARLLGWDYRKTVRFVMFVLRGLMDQDKALAKMKEIRKRLEEAFERLKRKVKQYVHRFRGKEVEADPSDETEDERLFLDAMAALAKTSPVHYRATIKGKLRSKDEATAANFAKWLEEHKKAMAAAIQKMEEEEKLSKIIEGAGFGPERLRVESYSIGVDNVIITLQNGQTFAESKARLLETYEKGQK